MADVVVQTSVRVILIDDEDRVLLVAARDPAADLTVWFMPGGTMEPGEILEETARREIAEEVEGLHSLDLRGPVWTRHHAHTWDRQAVDLTEWFFVARIGAPDLVLSVNETGPASMYFVGWRWWTLQELEAFTGQMAPRRIAELLPPIVHGEFPTEPFNVGV